MYPGSTSGADDEFDERSDAAEAELKKRLGQSGPPIAGWDDDIDLLTYTEIGDGPIND